MKCFIIFLICGLSPLVFAEPDLTQTVSAKSAVAAGEWILATPDVSQSGWNNLSSEEKIATSTAQDIVHLGSDWYWGTQNVYFYLGVPSYIFDQTNDTWLYALEAEDGVYYYEYSSQSWSWWPRDGSGRVRL